MDDNFSPRVKDVITYSKEEALRLGHDFIGTEHLMLGILRDGSGKAITILNNLYPRQMLPSVLYRPNAASLRLH